MDFKYKLHNLVFLNLQVNCTKYYCCKTRKNHGSITASGTQGLVQFMPTIHPLKHKHLARERTGEAYSKIIAPQSSK